MSKPYSIKWRLTIAIVSTVCMATLLAGIIQDRIVASRLSTEFDQALLAKARALVTLTKQDASGVELDFADEFMPEFEAPTKPEYFQIWLSDRQILERSRSLLDQDLPIMAGLSEQPRFANLILPDERQGRYVQVDFLAQIEDKSLRGQLEQERVSLVVAREREELDRVLNSLHWTTLAVSIGLIVLIAPTISLLITNGMRPINEVSRQVAQLDEYSIGERVQIARPSLELVPVINQLNRLLNRLEIAFERERRFSSDVAHELRTPLAVLRNMAEVVLDCHDDPSIAEDFYQEVLNTTLQMQRITENLLALARCERSIDVIEFTELDLATEVDTAWQQANTDANTHRIKLERSGKESLMVCTGIDQLRLILYNLFGNAIAYSPIGSTVTCTLEQQEERFSLHLSNPTESLHHDDLPYLFDRLWRSDRARSGEQHAGLGLTLVQAYTKQLGFDINVALTADHVFTISLTGLRQA